VFSKLFAMLTGVLFVALLAPDISSGPRSSRYLIAEADSAGSGDSDRRNRALARKRIAITHRIAAVKAEAPRQQTTEQQREQRSQLRHLARDLDRVTGDLVEVNMGLVRSFTRRFAGRINTEQRQDLDQAGVLGLVSAIESYDPDSGKLSTWARPRIVNEVTAAARQMSGVALTHSDFVARTKVRRAQHAEPEASNDRLVDLTGLPAAQVDRIIDVRCVVSADTTVHGVSMIEETADEQAIAPDALWEASGGQARRAMGELSIREVFVVAHQHARDGARARLSDTASLLGVSRETVRRDLRNAGDRLELLVSA
jgi:RNA polymerase sigma factor (sigma-70 family)